MYGGHVVAPCQLAHIGNDEAFHLFPEKVCKSPSIEKPWSLASLVVLGITLRHLFLRDDCDEAATLTERGLRRFTTRIPTPSSDGAPLNFRIVPDTSVAQRQIVGPY